MVGKAGGRPTHKIERNVIMIDFEHIAKTMPEAELEKVGQALLDGADAQQVKALFAAQGIELSEEDISKVMPGIIKQIAADPEKGEELSDEELENVAGGWLGKGPCEK